MSGFTPSDSALAAIGITATILSIISTAFCLVVLIAAAWVYSVPETRHTVDRISFRLMVWSMVFGMGYDMCYFLAEPKFAIIDPSSVQCKVVMYWQVVTMGAVNYFITCIAINLMLSVHFALNPLTLRLERWYIGVSLFIAFVVPIVPAALGHFGADPVYDACYFTAPNLKDRMRNFVLDLYLWQAAASLIACISVIITLTSLFRSGRATAKALLYRDPSNLTSGELSTALDSTSSHTGWCPTRIFKRNSSSTFQLQDQFLSIALRVALYPVVLVITNAILTTGDLYLSAAGGVDSKADYGLYIVYYLLYGGRNILLALIGMFIDPGLPRGVRLAYRLARSKPSRGGGAALGEGGDEEGDMDFMSALNSTPFRESTTGTKSGLDRFRGKRVYMRSGAGGEDESGRGIVLSSPAGWSTGSKESTEIITGAEETVVREEVGVAGGKAEGRGELEGKEREVVLDNGARERLARRERKEEVAKANLENLVHRL